MSDTATTPAVPTPISTPAVAVTPTPTVAAPTTDPVLAALEKLSSDVAALKATAPTAGSATVDLPDNPPATENLFTKGSIVDYTYNDPYDGATTRYGLVVDTLPDEGAGARSVVAWFNEASGPIGDHLLKAV